MSPQALDCLPRIALAHFDIPVIGLLQSKVGVELANGGTIGIEERIHSNVPIDHRLRQRSVPDPRLNRGPAICATVSCGSLFPMTARNQRSGKSLALDRNRCRLERLSDCRVEAERQA